MGVGQAEVGGLLVHQLGELGLAAGDVEGQHAGGVVGADDEHGPDQQVAGQLLALGDADAGLGVVDSSPAGAMTIFVGCAGGVGGLGDEELHQAGDRERDVGLAGRPASCRCARRTRRRRRPRPPGRRWGRRRRSSAGAGPAVVRGRRRSVGRRRWWARGGRRRRRRVGDRCRVRRVRRGDRVPPCRPGRCRDVPSCRAPVSVGAACRVSLHAVASATEASTASPSLRRWPIAPEGTKRGGPERQRDRATRRASRIASWTVRGATQSPACGAAPASGSVGRRKPQSTSTRARDRAVDAREAVARASTSPAPTPTQQAAPLDAHAGLGQAHVGRGEVAGAGQLVAGDVVLRDEHGPAARAPRRGRRRSGRRSGRTATTSPSAGSVDRAPADVGDVDAPRRPSPTSYSRRPARRRCTARRRVAAVGRPSSVPSRDVDAEPAAPRRSSQSTSAPFGPGRPRPARRRASARSTHASRGGPASAAHAAASSPAGPPPTTTHVAPGARRARTSRGPRSRGPTVGSPTHVTSGLRASRTWHVWLQRMHGRIRSASPARSLATRSGSAIWARVISTPRTRRVVVPPTAHSAWPDVDDRALQRTTGTSTAARDAGRGQVEVEAGRLVDVGPGLLDREDRAPHDDDVVDARATSSAAIAGAMLGRDAGPRRQLVARQPQPDDAVGADGGAHGGEDVAGEAQAVGAPLVVALVGQPGEELADQAVLAGVDLDAVAAGVDGGRGGGAEPGDDGGDVVGLHPLRDLAASHLGHARRRPQRRAGCRPTSPARRRGRATASTSAPCGRQAAATAAQPGVGPCAPAAPARRASRDGWTLAPSTTIVPQPPAGPAPVVGDVTVGKRAVVVAEVGHVRAEQDPVRRRPGTRARAVRAASWSAQSLASPPARSNHAGGSRRTSGHRSHVRPQAGPERGLSGGGT